MALVDKIEGYCLFLLSFSFSLFLPSFFLQLGRLSQLADLEPSAVLLEDVLGVVFPELLGCVLAGYAL